MLILYLMTKERTTSYPDINSHHRVVHAMMRGEDRRGNGTDHKKLRKQVGGVATGRPVIEQQAAVVARDLRLLDETKRAAEEVPVVDLTTNSNEELTFPHIANTLAHENTIIATIRKDLAKPDKGL